MVSGVVLTPLPEVYTIYGEGGGLFEPEFVKPALATLPMINELFPPSMSYNRPQLGRSHSFPLLLSKHKVCKTQLSKQPSYRPE
jgi:hypothetical protein